MKLFTLISAGLIAVAAMVPATASAQMHAQHTDRHETKRVVVKRTVVRTDNARHHRARARHHTRRVCRTEWRHHHRVRICRTVRR